MEWAEIRRNAGDFFHGAAFGKYEREFRKQELALHDLFMLLCYLELMGVPNPATLYLLDMYPLLLDEFHHWHRRMGMPHSPLDSMGCC
ncbi:MAG: cory-CC-star protein [Vicinamibacterales bacterium]